MRRVALYLLLLAAMAFSAWPLLTARTAHAAACCTTGEYCEVGQLCCSHTTLGAEPCNVTNKGYCRTSCGGQGD